MKKAFPAYLFGTITFTYLWRTLRLSCVTQQGVTAFRRWRHGVYTVYYAVNVSPSGCS
jgi:hypothetical protein